MAGSSEHGGAKVPTEHELVTGTDGIYTRGLSSGSASTLPMSDDQMAKAGEKPKSPVGFSK